MRDVVATIEINGVNRTSTLINYLISIEMTSEFSCYLKPSQLKLVFASNVVYTFSVNDRIRLTLRWQDEGSTYTSPFYYVDNIDDNLSSGSYTFDINAIEHYPQFSVELYDVPSTPEWSFQASANARVGNILIRVCSDLNIPQANCTFPTFGYATWQQNNINLGIRNRPEDINVTFQTKSPIQSIENINKALGCVAKIEGNSRIIMYRIRDTNLLPLAFTQDYIKSCLSLQFNPRLDNVAKSYGSWYVTSQSSGGGTAQWTLALQKDAVLINAANNKTKLLNSQDRGVYDDGGSAAWINFGAGEVDYLEALNYRMSFVGDPRIEAGKRFRLGSIFGRYSGDYYILRSVHKLSSGSWIVDIDAMPIPVVSSRLTVNFTSGIIR
jgi:hypothetical protein